VIAQGGISALITVVSSPSLDEQLKALKVVLLWFDFF
jgi:hypothetical protein